MKENQSSNSVYDTTIRLIVLLLIVVWCLLIMMPFASIILWSLILTFAMQPLHTGLSKKLGGRPKIASSILIGTMFLIIIVPAGFFNCFTHRGGKRTKGSLPGR